MARKNSQNEVPSIADQVRQQNAINQQVADNKKIQEVAALSAALVDHQKSTQAEQSSSKAQG